jgi:hypothetical protein
MNVSSLNIYIKKNQKKKNIRRCYTFEITSGNCTSDLQKTKKNER